MQFTDSPQQASEFARAALDRMAEEDIPANPDNYAVWYCYFSGNNQDLIRAIDVLVSNGQRFTEALNRALYGNYIGVDGERRLVREIGERAQGALEAVLDALRECSQGARGYGEKLAGLSTRLGRPDIGLDGLREIIDAIVEDSRAIAEQNRLLSDKLRMSSHQIEQMREDLSAARREAMTDGLTGISNRRLFDFELRAAATTSVEEGRPLSVLKVDIDCFKAFNDNHGRHAGDEVLKLVGRVLRDSIKGRDTAARYGGEEFAIILPDTALKNAAVVAEQIRARMASLKIVRRTSGEAIGSVTLSIGGAEYDPGEPLADLLRRADDALSQAKDLGRNCVATTESPSVGRR
ncbi:MAG: GGDEF domain-containing protein [Alphaproteobacteria bacterium]